MPDEPESRAVEWAEFLASAPPDTTQKISNLWTIKSSGWSVNTPDVLLYCDRESCEGRRFFEHLSGDHYVSSDKWTYGFMYFACRNCRTNMKIYSVAVKADSKKPSEGWATKIGEAPAFGPHTPARVITLIGPDRELFLRGRRAENRGLGIGAFSYYRRVVENQKSRIIDQIAKVAEKLGAKPEVLAEFTAAASETQFSKAIDKIKHGIPEALLIDGHNPLSLLHTALSDGLHDRSDEECLEIAQEIRIVLTELAERLSLALKQDAELTQAVSKLLARKTAKPTTA